MRGFLIQLNGQSQRFSAFVSQWEIAIFFEELLPRLKSVELAGTPRRTVTNFVGGPKSVPIRFKMAP
jgi:hypothetical protein